MKTIHLEVISDFICPWCYIGKARLDRVKAALAGEINIEIDLKPYLLYPYIPKGGAPKSDFAKKTKPGMGKSLREEAKKEGIEINYRKIERIPNSMEAHRLLWLVRDNSKKYQLAMKIFQGYFEEGRDIENPDYLIELGKSVEIERSILDDFKNTEEGKDRVANYINGAKEEFITLVPSLKIDRKILMPGLQMAEVWETYFRRAARIQ